MKKQKLFNQGYVLLLIVNFITAFSFYMIVSLLSKYLTGIGLSLSVAGAVIGLFSITSLLIRPFTGFMTDNFSKKWLVIIATVMTICGTLGYFMTDQVWLIVVLRMIHGIGFGINSTAVVSLAADYIPEERLGEGIGYFGLGQVLASAVGPGFGVEIMNVIGLKAAFIAAGAISVAAIGLMFFIANDTKVRSTAGKWSLSVNNLISVEIINYAVVSGLFSAVNGIISSYLILFAENRGIEGISLYFTIYAVCMFIIRPSSGKLMDRYGLKTVVLPGLLVTSGAMVLLGFSYSVFPVMLSAALRAFGQGAGQPALQAASIRKVGRDRIGVANSTYYLGGDIGQGIGPVIGGTIISGYGYTKLFLFCALLLLVGILIFLISEKRKSKERLSTVKK